MPSDDLTDDLDNLGNYHTNRDQTLGRVIATAAALIAQGAHLQRRIETGSQQLRKTEVLGPDAKRRADRKGKPDR